MAGLGEGRGEMSREEVASAKRAKSVGEVNSSRSSVSAFAEVEGLVLTAGG
jgi:hypothetical protein